MVRNPSSTSWPRRSAPGAGRPRRPAPECPRAGGPGVACARQNCSKLGPICRLAKLIGRLHVSKTIFVLLLGNKEQGEVNEFQLLQEETALAEGKRTGLNIEV